MLPAEPSRRRALTRRGFGVAAAGTAVVAGSVLERAEAGPYRPHSHVATAVPDPATRHALTRFSYGWTPELQERVERAGGFRAWFEAQLTDDATDADDEWYAATAAWWPTVTASHTELADRVRSGDLPSFWHVDIDYQRWALARRIHGEQQVWEMMAEFWEHHFHVPAEGLVGPHRPAYGRELRRLALGRFDELLAAAILHPAMALYLSNANSLKDAPNEDLGRELLELHTVGRGHYDEADVRASALLLTGHRVDKWRTWDHAYDPASHWTGAVRVMDFTHDNAEADGTAAVSAYLRHLARHPATAERIARKLAVRFIGDEPSAAVVARLAETYLDHDTAIAPVLRVLVDTGEFRAADQAKVRTSDEDVVATYRALGARLAAPISDASAAQGTVWQAKDLGNYPFGWGTPDGRPDDGLAWSSTARFLASLDLHQQMAARAWPTEAITHREPTSWLPERALRFGALVDHLSRTLLGLRSTSVLLRAACEATGCEPSTIITADHRVADEGMPLLLTVLLDSPAHMER
ncbi:DUF1800 domain-containing protein [Nocardioides panacisoli]|uniref:DUF1800 domain-containing protein n=1 Tax=Nocardioides panacisoli TaxID=627624 RepID=UPI001C6310C6|nr:DUF1800 domain-containing protein [Nocardioides panacisoli]QYJ03336.1 DUF1800 domain-containing protein [Nocardioides panacisoli]